jgi:hypothetical protein
LAPPATVVAGGVGRAAVLGQQIMAAWKDPLARLPPKNSSWRTWMPVVLRAGPPVISTVAGSNGMLVLAEQRVAIIAHAGRGRLVASVYCPVAARNELVSGEPRAGSPVASTTAILALAAGGQITARWNAIPALSPPAMFLRSM